MLRHYGSDWYPDVAAPSARLVLKDLCKGRGCDLLLLGCKAAATVVFAH